MTIAPTSLTAEPQPPKPRPPRPGRAFQEVLAQRRAEARRDLTKQGPGLPIPMDGEGDRHGSGQTRAFGFDELGILANRTTTVGGDAPPGQSAAAPEPGAPAATPASVARLAAPSVRAAIEARVSSDATANLTLAASEQFSPAGESLAPQSSWRLGLIDPVSGDPVEPVARAPARRAAPQAGTPDRATVRLTLAGPDDGLQLVIAVPGLIATEAAQVRRALTRAALAHGVEVSELRLNGEAEKAEIPQTSGDVHGHRPG